VTAVEWRRGVVVDCLICADQLVASDRALGVHAAHSATLRRIDSRHSSHEPFLRDNCPMTAAPRLVACTARRLDIDISAEHEQFSTLQGLRSLDPLISEFSH